MRRRSPAPVASITGLSAVAANLGNEPRRRWSSELSEEYGLQVTVGAQLGVLESLFVYDGRACHEVVLVHEADFAASADYSIERVPCRDDSGTVGTWRPRDGSPYPLYPDGLDDLMLER
jgi:hypothetical protein